jgi:hypothetical protein
MIFMYIQKISQLLTLHKKGRSSFWTTCVCVNATPWWIEPTSCVQFCCCFDGARHHEASWMMAIPCLTKLVFQVASWSNLRKTWNPEVSGPCTLHCFFIVPLNSQALAKHHCTPRISGSSRHHSWPKRRRNASVFCEDWTLSLKWICSSQMQTILQIRKANLSAEPLLYISVTNQE